MAYCTQDDVANLIPPAQLIELTTDSGSYKNTKSFVI
jgi:hypothetical protein